MTARQCKNNEKRWWCLQNFQQHDTVVLGEWDRESRNRDKRTISTSCFCSNMLQEKNPCLFVKSFLVKWRFDTFQNLVPTKWKFLSTYACSYFRLTFKELKMTAGRIFSFSFLVFLHTKIVFIDNVDDVFVFRSNVFEYDFVWFCV